MIEKTLMGMPTQRCGLVIWLHELIFVWWFYRLIFVWCVSIPISQYPHVTWGMYLEGELRLRSLTSTDSLDNPLCFSGTHRSTVQKGNYKYLVRLHICHVLQDFPCWCWCFKCH